MIDLSFDDVFGFIRSDVDAHTLGIYSIANLLTEHGYGVKISDAEVANAVARISELNGACMIRNWIHNNRITRLGFSYRLDPSDAVISFDKLYCFLKNNGMLRENGGSILSLYFAGLPQACVEINRKYKNGVCVFFGGESPVDSLVKMGVPVSRISSNIAGVCEYDEMRLHLGKRLVESEEYLQRVPLNRSGYRGYGTREDKLTNRLSYAYHRNELPLIRAHVGPYNSNRIEAIKECKHWLKELASVGLLDIASIATSQLSQSCFGEHWGDRPNGGGVPVNQASELIEFWDASRPMLVRMYAGTKNIPFLANLYEGTINIAWHALSFWWFCKLDGRGPNTVLYNLQEHIETMKMIARMGKPLEANVPHHFSFRGSDDCTYILTGYLAANMAKLCGIRHFVLQVMLNTPKCIWGVQDLAKARTLLKLVKDLEDESFHVYLQPRAGLDYFSTDIFESKCQLAATTMMMDDIDPENNYSPDIVHVVGFSEGSAIADPKVINESIKITLESLRFYRKLKHLGKVPKVEGVDERQYGLYHEVRRIYEILVSHYSNLYTAEGFYKMMVDGIFPMPPIMGM